MPAQTVSLLTDPLMIEHDPGPAHPERPDRLRAILEDLQADPIEHAPLVPARACEESHPLALHDPDYVARVLSLRGKSAQLDADTHVSPRSIECALLSAGAVRQAARLAADNQRAFALARPPGHHAERAESMGFCLFSNIALAADDLIRSDRAQRVMILDWDVHHANGTAHILANRADILVLSIHQSPLWPGTGDASEIGAPGAEAQTINVPLPPASTDADYLMAMREVVRPAAEWFEPDVLLVSAGYDAHANDPLAQMLLTDDGFARLARETIRLAHEVAGGRVSFALEGGYNLAALAAGVRSSILALLGSPIEPEEADPGAPSAGAKRAIERVREAHRPLGSWAD